MNIKTPIESSKHLIPLCGLLLIFSLSACLPQTTSQTETTDVTSDQDTTDLPPTVQFHISSASINSGGSVTLTWVAQNSDICEASGDWSGEKASTGSELMEGLTQDANYTITCSRNSAIASASVNVAVSAPPPVVVNSPGLVFTADQASISYNEMVTLTWDATNVTSCDATGDWSGAKAVSGNEVIGPLTADATFNLSCQGDGGTVDQAVNIVVSPLIAPTILLTSDKDNITLGDSVTINWSVENADQCVASGSWSGTKDLTGSEIVSPVDASNSFILTCTGSGVDVQKQVAVTVQPLGSNSVSGAVDSSLINRLGTNKLYIFSGNVTPDDQDGDSGDPLLIVDIQQETNGCGFSYAVPDLAAGNYTLAVTPDGALDNATSDDSLNFTSVENITLSSSQSIQNFVANNILRVGADKSYKTVREAAAVASSGDVIEVDAGEYLDDIVVWRTNNLTVRGVGGFAHIKGTQRIPYAGGNDLQNGMGLWVVKASGLTVENIEFSGAQVDDLNGAGIRNQGTNLTVCNGYFHDNENGFLGGAYGTLLIEHSEFDLNGWGDIGYTHNMYIDDGDKFILKHNYVHHANIGHNVKSRAKENHILYNRLMDEASGTSSYVIDVPNGGLTYVIGNLIEQGPNTDNSTMVNYGAEGLSSDGRQHKLYVVHNTLVNDRSAGTFLNINGSTTESKIVNNIFSGPGNVLSGPGNLLGNDIQNAPAFVDAANYDYRISSTSSAIDVGVDPGIGAGVELNAVYQYVHPRQWEARVMNGSPDAGAYEYSN